MNARTDLPPHLSAEPGADLPVLDAIRALDGEMLDIRHQIHQNPELGFEEVATSDLVAERLARWGYTVHRGLGQTGVVGTLTVGDGTTADRYNTSTINIFATAVALDGGAVSGTAVHAAAKSPVLTATSGSDWGAVTAGALTLKIFYMF